MVVDDVFHVDVKRLKVPSEISKMEEKTTMTTITMMTMTTAMWRQQKWWW
jgi:hypothetical protein